MKRTMIALASVTLLAVAGCADGPDDAAGPVVVTGVDYAYQDLPASVDVGAELAFTNASDNEVHELVLARLPDGEDRAASELVQLPREEMMGLLLTNLVGVSVAPPNAEGMVVEGDLTVREPGRYLVVCVIPTGADPDEFMAAAAESDGPPDVEGGPLHIVHGMYGEFTAEN